MMGLKDIIWAIREYPTAHADLEAVRLGLRQARTALEKSELECQRLGGDCGEARRRADFSEKKSSALQWAVVVKQY